MVRALVSRTRLTEHISAMVKRLCDLVAAGLLLVCCAPLLGVIALLVARRMGRPIIFRQLRAGRGGRPFPLYKLRTMTDARDADGHLLPDADRLTPFGRLLRATSLDELPQLWNVLRGEMSLVGPRPLLLEYNERYDARQARRLDARPGITGWAQVNGRNAISWEEKFALDVWYVEHQSLWLDLRILALTLSKVLRRDGISQRGEATMTPFMGRTQSEESERVI